MSSFEYTWSFIASALVETRAFDNRSKVNLPGAAFEAGDHVTYKGGTIPTKFVISGVNQHGPCSYGYSVRTLRGDLFPFCFYEWDLILTPGGEDMYIFVFVPSKGWSYCGGAMVVVAESPEEAVDVALAIECGSTFYLSEEDVGEEGGVDIWYLDYSARLGEECGPARVVVCNWNYS